MGLLDAVLRSLRRLGRTELIVLGLAGLVVLALGSCGLAGAAYALTRGDELPKRLGRVGMPVALLRLPSEVRRPAPISDAQRHKGYHECNPPDPAQLGYYSPYMRLRMGRMLVPQNGGHTADMGYDVLVHFHGYEALRKTLVQVTRGISYVGIDRGLGSGPYTNAFRSKAAFPALRASIERGLKKHSGDDRAHIRHLALSAWSAGYGAINQILKHGDEGIDAVILLDGLHAGWKPGRKRGGGVDSASALFIEPVLDYARRAQRGEGPFFVFTHSRVDPGSYPSTSLTADLMLSELGLERKKVDPGDDPFGMTGRVDAGELHIWSYAGRNERAHCTHIFHIAEIVQLLEWRWNTPPMDRTVPITKKKRWGR